MAGDGVADDFCGSVKRVSTTIGGLLRGGRGRLGYKVRNFLSTRVSVWEEIGTGGHDGRSITHSAAAGCRESKLKAGMMRISNLVRKTVL